MDQFPNPYMRATTRRRLVATIAPTATLVSSRIRAAIRAVMSSMSVVAIWAMPALLRPASLAQEAPLGSKMGRRRRCISQTAILSQQLVKLASPMAIYSGTPTYNIYIYTHTHSNKQTNTYIFQFLKILKTCSVVFNCSKFALISKCYT